MLAMAGFTDVNVVEHTWREPPPPADEAWFNILQSTAGVPLRTLRPSQQQFARERFLTDFSGRRVFGQADSQLLYVATATKS